MYLLGTMAPATGKRTTLVCQLIFGADIDHEDITDLLKRSYRKPRTYTYPTTRSASGKPQ
jgi:hypothetical protein